MSLRTANLNLMPVLQELLKHQSVTKAAHTLGLSPSATSQALTQLRILLDDPLLVRVGASLKLTPKAIDLIGPLNAVCGDLETLLERDSFQPHLARREFRIASSDLLILLFARQMMQILQTAAPGVSLHFLDVGHDLTDRMAAREIDFALLPSFAVEDLAPAPLRFTPLDTGSGVALMCADHPLAAKGAISQADLRAYQFVVFQPDPIMKDPRRALMTTAGEPIQVALRVPQMTLVPHLIQGTPYIAIVPTRLAEIATASLPLVYRPLAYRKTNTVLGMAWSPVQDGDPAHRWFRTIMEERLRMTPPPPRPKDGDESRGGPGPGA